MRERADGALTLVEVLVAGVIVAIALPALLTGFTSAWKLDAAQVSDAHATHLAHLALENMLYRLYNGHRPAGAAAHARSDSRGYRLNDSHEARLAGYRRESYLAFFEGLGERGKHVIGEDGRGTESVSQYFRQIHQPRDGRGTHLTESNSPDLAASLKSFTVDVDVALHRDDGGISSTTSTHDEPAVDLARVTVVLSWPSATGREVISRSFATRLTRYLFEDNPLNFER